MHAAAKEIVVALGLKGFHSLLEEDHEARCDDGGVGCEWDAEEDVVDDGAEETVDAHEREKCDVGGDIIWAIKLYKDGAEEFGWQFGDAWHDC